MPTSLRFPLRSVELNNIICITSAAKIHWSAQFVCPKEHFGGVGTTKPKYIGLQQPWVCPLQDHPEPLGKVSLALGHINLV